MELVGQSEFQLEQARKCQKNEIGIGCKIGSTLKLVDEISFLWTWQSTLAKNGKMVSKIGLKIGNWCWNSSKKISKWN